MLKKSLMFIILTLSTLLTLILSGCGQSGPLYLPDHNQTKHNNLENNNNDS